VAANQSLSLFISSKMQELIEERRAVQTALSHYKMHGWLWEKDAGARPESIRQTYLKEVEACDLYIGLFWLGYGPDTIKEFEHARLHHKPCLIYEKHVDIVRRDARLQAFLDRIGEVADGLAICRFMTVDELAGRVQDDVLGLLTRQFRAGQKSSTARQQPHRKVVARDHSIAVGSDNYGTITQHNIDGLQPGDDGHD